MEHNKVEHFHSATLDGATVKSVTMKSATSNSETLEQCNINSEYEIVQH